MNEKDQETVRAMIKDELRKLLKGVDVVPTRQARKIMEDKTVKRSFTLPASVSARLDRLGGVASSHVTAALRMYLNMRDEALK